jgi:hypothetical protein
MVDLILHILQGALIALVILAFLLWGLRQDCLRRWRDLRWLGVEPPGNAGEEEAITIAWYKTKRVEPAIVTLSLSISAAALSLPGFARPGEHVSLIVWLFFRAALLLASVLATLTTLLLYWMYVWQSSNPSLVLEQPPRSDSWRSGSPLSVRMAGPYALLSFAMALLFLGLSLVPYILLAQ